MRFGPAIGFRSFSRCAAIFGSMESAKSVSYYFSSSSTPQHYFLSFCECCYCCDFQIKQKKNHNLDITHEWRGDIVCGRVSVCVRLLLIEMICDERLAHSMAINKNEQKRKRNREENCIHSAVRPRSTCYKFPYVGLWHKSCLLFIFSPIFRSMWLGRAMTMTFQWYSAWIHVYISFSTLYAAKRHPMVRSIASNKIDDVVVRTKVIR